MASDSFTVWGFIAKPPSETCEAVVDPAQLSAHFTTAGAVGRMVTGETVQWEFADFPGPFPVEVVEAVDGERLVFLWESAEGASPTGETRVEMVFESVDDGARTKLTITESGFASGDAAREAIIGNCMGWSYFISGLKAWLEHGVVLRNGFFV